MTVSVFRPPRVVLSTLLVHLYVYEESRLNYVYVLAVSFLLFIQVFSLKMEYCGTCS